MAFQDDFNLIQDSGFQVRVKMAVLKSAAAVVGEDVSSFGATQADKRHSLAVAALMGGAVNSVDHSPDSVYQKFLDAVAAQSPANNDTDVETKVTSLWDDMAGVKFSEKTP